MVKGIEVDFFRVLSGRRVKKRLSYICMMNVKGVVRVIEYKI